MTVQTEEQTVGNPIPSRDARQAAAELFRTDWAAKECRDGGRDDDARVQAFARFEARIRADAYEQAAKVASNYGALAEAISPDDRQQANIARQIAQRIRRKRALSDQPDSTNEGLAELLREVMANIDGFEFDADLHHRIDTALSTGRQA